MVVSNAAMTLWTDLDNKKNISTQLSQTNGWFIFELQIKTIFL